MHSMDSNNLPPPQSSASVASNTAHTSPNSKTSTTLLSDPTFQLIHNAFLLGWSLKELKSRIQITACILSLNPDAVINTLHQLTSTQSDSQPQPQDNQNNLPDSIDSLLQNVVLKDVIPWKDVKNQQAQSSGPLSQEKSLSTELRDNVWLTSVLRAIFMQIATLHVKRFPSSNVTDTIYDIRPPQEDDQNNQYAPYQQKPFPYLYLYPDAAFDYANIGIRQIKTADVGNNYIDIDSFVKNFRLYDVTRRALNCLTLLLTSPEDSLIPEALADYQQALVQQVLAPPPGSTESDSSN